jgi:Flp pilus assembly CpaF family ATPase
LPQSKTARVKQKPTSIALNSYFPMSGHPIITTIHAQDLEAMPERIARLAMMGNPTLYKEELLDDIAHHLRYYVYLEKKENADGSISRRLQSIGYLDEKSKTMQKLYERVS